ncbi:hypothetical protein [uncultured Clostridium sp.]|uniref:hypothetical protein n=1 Tax=uncultured Clostridium sp. TaxID=59620 RepID=UPI0025E5E67F|nr:hypothetical protein [uncultured Clostridium sp.]
MRNQGKEISKKERIISNLINQTIIWFIVDVIFMKKVVVELPFSTIVSVLIVVGVEIITIGLYILLDLYATDYVNKKAKEKRKR